MHIPRGKDSLFFFLLLSASLTIIRGADSATDATASPTNAGTTPATNSGAASSTNAEMTPATNSGTASSTNAEMTPATNSGTASSTNAEMTPATNPGAASSTNAEMTPSTNSGTASSTNAAPAPAPNSSAASPANDDLISPANSTASPAGPGSSSLMMPPAPGLLPAEQPNGDMNKTTSATSAFPNQLLTKGFPNRPAPIVELGHAPFLDSGPIGTGFVLPTGAVWQPEFLVFGTARTALQTFDDGKTNYAEFANRLDLFGNLYLTPTERILIGVRPLDRDSVYDAASGYKFAPHSGIQDDINLNVRTLYFEGDFGEIFPNLDPNDTKSLDYGFSIGRQPLNFQNGIMINDDMIESVGITRTSLFALGASALRTTALFGFDDIDRNNGLRDSTTKLAGLFTTADYATNTVDLDLAYENAASGDGVYAGLSSTQRFMGHFNTTFSVNSSLALDQQNTAVSTGTLLFSQISMGLPHSKDEVYLNAFWGIRNYASAARDPDEGGALGQTGILFASQALGSYGAPLGNYADDSVGAAIGWQHFIGGADRQIVFELGGRTNTRTPRFFDQPSSVATATQYQMKLNQHCVLIFGAFVGFPDSSGTAYGLRSELLVKF